MDRSTTDAVAIELMISQHGLALISQLRELGWSYDQIARRVRKGILVRHGRHVVSLGRPGTTFLARAMRHVLSAGPRAVAALWTAAELHALEAPRDRQIHALVHGNRPRPPSPTLYVHRTRFLPPEHVTRVQRIPATSIDRTIIDCSSRLDRWSALRLLDSCGASPTMWRRIHTTAVRLSNGRPGIQAVITATRPDGANRFRSMLERRAHEALRAHGVPDGEWNVPISDTRGHIREVDLVFSPQQLAVEYDGLRLHAERGAHQRDRATDRRLQALGWRVLRFTWEDVVHRPDQMAAEVLAALHCG